MLVDISSQARDRCRPTSFYNFLREYIQNHRSENSGKECFYFRIARFGQLIKDENFFLENIDQEVTDKVKNNSADLFLDLSHEGVPYKPGFLKAYDKFLATRILNGENIHFFQTNSEFGKLLSKVDDASPAAKKLNCGYFHDFYYRFLQLAAEQNLSELGRANLAAPFKTRSARFLSFNGAPRPHRIALVAELIRRASKHPAIITFGGLTNGKFPVDGMREQSAAQYQDTAKFIPLLDTYEFHTDANTQKLSPELAFEIDPHLYERAVCSVVSETEWSAGEVTRFTEKTIKPLLMGHPFFVFGNPKTISTLRDTYGFDVFGDILDHSYDEILHPVERFKAALASLDQFFHRRNAKHYYVLRERIESNIQKFEGQLLQEEISRCRLELKRAFASPNPTI